MNDFRDYYNYKNNNYNQPTYEQNSNNIIDPYQGFIRVICLAIYITVINLINQ